MAVRGDLLGFLCCGPKPDRTPYLDDELRAIEQLAHHAGLAAALLPQGERATKPMLLPITS